MLNDKIELRVRYADTDQMKRVYYSKYFEYFEVGRIGLLRRYGLPYSEIELKLNYFLPVVETYAKMIKPVLFDELISIKTYVRSKPSARMKFEYEISRHEQLLAVGYTVHAFINSISNKPSRPPDQILMLFNGKKNF